MTSNKIKQFDRSKPATITVENSDINEFVKLASQVGHNTSKIETLEKKSHDLDGVKMEITEIKTRHSSFEQRLAKLDANDASIESGISKFRYWLMGSFAALLLLVCGAIWSSLTFGLDQYSKDKTELKESLSKRIDKVDEDSKDRSVTVNGKLDKIILHLMEQK